VKSGLMIIDQHRAHIRILFENYRSKLAAHKMHAQKILFAQSVQLDAQEIVTLSHIGNELADFGFELSNLGGGTFAINAIPEGLDGVDPQHLLHDILANAQEQGSSIFEEITDSLALTLAKNAAIPYGQVLSNEEMENIINQLFLCPNFNYTPNGKSILCILQQSQIEQMLG
jgi:DNA mismatch repair protein MutL